MREGELTEPELERLLRADLTYADVGGTRGELPPDHHGVRRSMVVGQGTQRFDDVARTVLQWGVQRRAGLAVRASTRWVQEGSVAVLRLGPRRFGLDAPVRVVYVVDEPRRRGFAYGTLPGHPESGEEAFVASLDDDDRVLMSIVAFSRPASRLARVGGPGARLAQSLMTRRYLRAV